MTEHAITQWLERLGLGQYADAFRSEQIDLQALPSLTEEHLERLGVAAMGHRVRMLQAIAELDSAPADAAALRDLVQRLPTPVALPLAEYVAEADPRIKLWSACDAVEDLLRLLVFLGVGELSRLSSGPSQALPDGLRRSIQRMIEAPTLGSWRRMAEEVARQASEVPTDDSALPELLSSVVETLAPLLDGPAGERTPERSFLVMRNRLAHGSIGRAQSAKLLTIWQPDFEALWLRFAWLTDLHLVVRRSEGFGVLRGPTTSPLPFEPEAQPGAATLPIVQRLEEQLGSGHSVLALRGEHIIPLWPLALFDVPQHPFEPTEPDTPPLPQVYARLGQINLQYHPLGDTGVLQSEPADEAGKERFLALFRPAAPRPEAGKPAGFTVPGFEESFRSLAPRLIGREPERAALRRALDETPSGVLWLDGPAGMGKSYLVAHLADALLSQGRPDTLVLGYQFRADDARCARDPFLRFAIERIAAFLGQDQDPAAEKEQTKPLDRLESLVDALADGPEGGRRLIFLLDGLDEIAERDRRFVADIPLAIPGPSLTWLCAGRPEQGLPEAFAAAGATRVFPEGLPPMGPDDIRAMLMAFIGPLRKTLLRRDTEEGERIANPFIDKVARLSEGLPLYVKYVVEDILARRYRVLDAGETLPPGLDAYHAELIRRLGIGDLQQVLTPLAATLAVAWEPLPAPALADLLCRRTLVPEGEPGLALVRKALGLIQSMIRAARAPADRDGRDEPGYVLYHHSLAQHMAESAACTHSVAEARRSLAEQAKTLRTGPLAPYLYRRGIAHLLESGKPDAALALLTDFDYLMDRLRTLPDPDAVEGLGADWRAVLRRVQIHDRATRLWESFFREREHILRRGDWRWPAYKILLQLAVEHADDSPVTLAAECWLESGQCDWIWLRNPQRVTQAVPNRCLRVWEGVSQAVVSTPPSAASSRIVSWHPHSTRMRLWEPESSAPVAIIDVPSGVDRVLVLPNGRILSRCKDDTLRLWDPGNGSLLATLAGPHGLVLPDERLLSWSADNTLRLWDAECGAHIASLAGHTAAVSGAVQFADRRILSWSEDKTLRIWDADSGVLIATLAGHSGAVSGGSATLNGRILSWSKDETVRLWDAADGAPIAILNEPVGGALACSKQRFVTWLRWSSLRLWSAEDGAPIATLTGVDSLRGFTWLPGGRVLAWLSDDTLRVWDAVSGSPTAILAGHTNAVRGALVLADGRILSWSNDHTLRIWDGVTGALLAILEGHTEQINDAVALPDGRILSLSSDYSVRVWDSKNGELIATLTGHTSSPQGAGALPDGRIVSWSTDDTLRLWDGESGASCPTLAGHTATAWGALPLANGQVLSWSSDHTLRIWNALDGALLRTLAGHTRGVTGATLLPDGRVLSWSEDYTLRLWNTECTAPLTTLAGHESWVDGGLVLSGGRILSWSLDCTLRLWEASSGATLAVLAGHSQWVKGALLLSNGHILSWSDDYTLRLWDGASGAAMATLVGHTSAVSGALELADGRVLSWSEDHTLRLWQAERGALLTTLVGHTSFVVGALTLPNGRILSRSGDRSLRLWDAEDGTLLATLPDSGARGALVLTDEFIVSWDVRHEVVVWKSEKGQMIRLTFPWTELPWRNPAILLRIQKGERSQVICGQTFGWSLDRAAGIATTAHTPPICWHGHADVESRALLPTGVLVVTLESDHVFCLQLYHGNRRIAIGEYERGETEPGRGVETTTT